MDFHLAGPEGDIYLFSMDDCRNVRFQPNILDAHTVKASHEIQGPADEGRIAGKSGPGDRS